MAIAGLSFVILMEQPVISALGALMWGLGSSLGFPVGMSAAADNPQGVLLECQPWRLSLTGPS